ncbi:MAG TPA: hypothetical protein VKV27_16580 [Solirubrobacteraceae bacterium]|nr:hypothetical protein [Solirubrobacteraceae bacterium]
MRRFFVEKPAASSYVDWRICLRDMPDAAVFVGHSYLFSRAFQIAFESCRGVAAVRAMFDKDRAQDDRRLRGADARGRLADIFEIEAPHPFAMALALEPALELQDATYTALGERAPGEIAPTRCEARLSHRALGSVHITCDLRAPRRRVLELCAEDGERIVVAFPLSARSLEAHVRRIDARGRRTCLYRGPDDLLRAALVAGLRALSEASVPWLASPQFAALVVARIAEARRRAEAARLDRGRSGNEASPKSPSALPSSREMTYARALSNR